MLNEGRVREEECCYIGVMIKFFNHDGINPTGNSL